MLDDRSLRHTLADTQPCFADNGDAENRQSKQKQIDNNQKNG